MKSKFATTFWFAVVLLVCLGILISNMGIPKLPLRAFGAPAQASIDLDATHSLILLTVTVYYATMGTPPPPAPPTETFSLGDHLTADHFQKTRYWSVHHSWLTNDARETQIYFETMTALAPTATPTASPSKTATATPTRTPTPTATPFPAIIPYPTGFPPVCPGGGGEWMWVDGELVFVCGVSWE